jgi:Tol biopolymer transport system component
MLRKRTDLAREWVRFLFSRLRLFGTPQRMRNLRVAGAYRLPKFSTLFVGALLACGYFGVGLVQPVAAADDEASSDANGLPLEPERSVAFTTTEATWLSLDVSPDGRSLVLEILGDLYLLPVAGGEARRITQGLAFDSQPRFSPSGDRLVFVSDRDGKENLWLLDLTQLNTESATEPVKLTKGGKQVHFASPDWSPDGKHVVTSRTTWGLGTFELWAYHVKGGKGLRLTEAKASKETPTASRDNALGAVYSRDGRYLYYANKNGGFGYNLRSFPWQVARRDLRTGSVDILTQALGGALRPALSPDGRWLVYGTRHEQQTGLRIRDLHNGADRWLAYPVEHDEQESRFTRDLLPGYAFTPDSRAVIYSHQGGIRQVDVESGTTSEIPFSAAVEQQLGPRLYFPYRLGLGPVKARLIQDPELSPEGSRLAFSAFTRLYVYDLRSGRVRAVSPPGMKAFHPTWSPDGSRLAFVSWTSKGGHIWRMDGKGGRLKQLSEAAGYYTDPAWSPDGKRIVALRASSYERLYRESDFGAPVGSDLVWLPAGGGAARLIIPSRGLSTPHFSHDPERVYLYLSAGIFPRSGNSGLVSIRYDGTDRRNVLVAKGPGVYFAEEIVPATDIRLSPDGEHALIQHANQLYVAALLNTHLQDVSVDLDAPVLPLARVTDVGADYFGWGTDGDASVIYWSVGHQLYQRPLAAIEFQSEEDSGVDKDSDAKTDQPPGPYADATLDAVEAKASEQLAEQHDSAVSFPIEVYLPRHEPEGTVVLTGGTVITMQPHEAPLADALVVVRGGRITYVGSRENAEIPAGAAEFDISGQFVVPGYIDTHAHYRPLRRVLDTDNWGFLASLAYGVTTGLDVQPSTTDVLAYQDLIDAGLMLGPRALSTGPGIFSNNSFRSLEHTQAVLRRYRDHYGVRNLKAYIAGNRQQRQWVVQAAKALKLMPTTEGALDLKLDMTHVLDGFSGNEHNFPVLGLYSDTVELVAASQIAYTPTLLVNYGGPSAEGYFYTRESPHNDAKLRRFTPANVIAQRSLRNVWYADQEYTFPRFAEHAARILRKGGRVGVGSHGQLQGLGYHWELWALARGLSNAEALTVATRGGAEIIGVAQDLGTISPGKLADLLVLRSNPLVDIRNSADIRFVMKNGELFEADSMDMLWPQAKPLPDQWWWDQAPPGISPPTPAD